MSSSSEGLKLWSTGKGETTPLLIDALSRISKYINRSG
jgi:hypothetical protein